MKIWFELGPRHAPPGGSGNARIPLPLASSNAPSEPELPLALGGERITFGGVNCCIAGNGPPMVLVHSINAAPSAAEMRPLFERHAQKHTVCAIDLPGLGQSERPDRVCDPRLMTNALHALADQVRNRCGAATIDALAASLGCEFLVRAAGERLVRDRHNWRTTVYQTGAWPYFEVPSALFAGSEEFRGGDERRASA